MKISSGLALTLLTLTAIANTRPPEHLQQAFGILSSTYPNVEVKRFPKPPADSAWFFRAADSRVGSVEVGFQGDQVVYMLFRRGVGGVSWKKREIDVLHDVYCKPLLKERKCGDAYGAGLLSEINAAFIVRHDFDPKSLLSGL